MKIVIQLGREPKRHPKTGRVIQAGNTNVYVEPAEDSYRGEWSRAFMPPGWNSEPTNAWVPEKIPGYHIALDTRAKTVSIIDPLYGTSKGKSLEEASKDGREPVTLGEPDVRRNLSEIELWRWVKWMYRATVGEPHERCASVIEGEFPKVVIERVEKEREWDLGADRETGKRHWEKEPALAGAGS